MEPEFEKLMILLIIKLWKITFFIGGFYILGKSIELIFKIIKLKLKKKDS